MKRSNYLFLFSFLTFSLALSAQTERKITRTGNTQYELGNFVDAEINYKKALEQNANLLEAQFNLGDALAKQDRFEEALASFDLVSSTSEDEQLKANAYHNKGNVQLQQQDLEGAIESYKEALRTNPKDHQTRYNYAYAKKQLEQQQEQQQDQDKEQNQDQDQQENENSENKDHQNKEDAENEEQNDSEQEQQEQQDQGDTKEDETQENDQNSGETDGEDAKDDQEEKQGEVKENKLSPEEAQRLLEALKQEENKVQAKMKKHKIKGSKVKIEKDW